MRIALLGVLGLLGSGAISVRAQDATPSALVARGDSAWDRGDHAAALAAYEAVVRADSAFSSRALFRLGTLHAWAERHAQAVACHQLYVRLEPDDLEGRTVLGRTLAWASRFPESIAAYDSVLGRDSLYRDAGLGKATTLAWWGRLTEAIREVERWQRLRPADQEVALARAQYLAWAGRLDDALRIYDSLATTGGGEGAAEAEKGRARVLAWRGDLDRSESRWRSYLQRHGDDASAWVGLAQVLRWMGRSFDARDALDRALAIAPDDRDGREQMRWVRAETRPQSSVGLVLARDSEENTLLQQDLHGALALRGNVRVTGNVRRKTVGASGAATDASTTGAAAGVQWQPPGTAWTMRGEAGLLEFPGVSGASVTRARYMARVAGRLATRWRLGAGVTQEPLDDVLASLDSAVSFTGADVDVSVALRPQLTLGLAVSGGSASGRGVETDRTTGVAALRWTISRGLSTAITHREVAWSEPAYGVFFAPQRFAITEASVAWERARDLGLVAASELGIGAQGVRFESDPLSRNTAMRAALRLGWRPIPGREIVAGLVYANVAGAGAITASEYSYAALQFSGRWTF